MKGEDAALSWIDGCAFCSLDSACFGWNNALVAGVNKLGFLSFGVESLDSSSSDGFSWIVKSPVPGFFAFVKSPPVAPEGYSGFFLLPKRLSVVAWATVDTSFFNAGAAGGGISSSLSFFLSFVASGANSEPLASFLITLGASKRLGFFSLSFGASGFSVAKD